MKRSTLSESEDLLNLLNEEVTAIHDEIEVGLSGKEQLSEITDLETLTSPISESKPVSTNSVMIFPHLQSEIQHIVDVIKPLEKVKDSVNVNTINTIPTEKTHTVTETMVKIPMDSSSMYASAVTSGALEFQSNVNTIPTEETSTIQKVTETMVATPMDSYSMYASAVTTGELEWESFTSNENEDATLYDNATRYFSATSHPSSWVEKHSSQYRYAHEQLTLAS